VSVGSVYYNGQQATGAPYSQWGKGLKVILPGGYASSMDVNYDSFKDSILSPSYSRSSGSGYYWMEGTSMACPVATSIVALIKATRPSSSASAYNKAIAVINVLYNLTGYIGASAETLPADQQRGWGMPSFS
jgi:subtilisin family serine protease